MEFNDPLVLIELGINSIFMFISILILFTFLSRFRGSIPFRQTNVLGFILISLGLSFHILGQLLIIILAGESYFGTIIHFIRAFVSLAIVMFIMGTAFIAYYNSDDSQRKYYKTFAWIFLFTGMTNVFYHFFIFYNRNTVDFTVFGQDPQDIDLGFLTVEMISLTIIYVAIYITSKASIRPLVEARYRLLSLTSLGFVLVILIDTLLTFGVLPNQSAARFFGLFFLHILTVGSMYLLVFMPDRYKRLVGITPAPN